MAFTPSWTQVVQMNMNMLKYLPHSIMWLPRTPETPLSMTSWEYPYSQQYNCFITNIQLIQIDRISPREHTNLFPFSTPPLDKLENFDNSMCLINVGLVFGDFELYSASSAPLCLDDSAAQDSSSTFCRWLLCSSSSSSSSSGKYATSLVIMRLSSKLEKQSDTFSLS